MRFRPFCDALSSTVSGKLISRFVVISVLPILFGITHPAHADDTAVKESPWILIPTLSHVLAWQVKGRWTDDAPVGGYSSVELRGYVRGNYLAPNYSHVQIEDRISFTERWGMSVFGGVGCLYDGFSDCGESDNLYAAVGAGAILTLKPEAGIVVRAEIAKGEADEYFAYISVGNPF